MDALDALIRDGVSLARLVELTAQCLRVGPVDPVAWEDFQLARSGGLGECRRLSGFVHRVVVHRRDEAIRGGIGCVRILLFVPMSGSGLTWCPLLHFLQCEPHLTHGGSGVWPGLTKNSERPGFPIFVVLGKGRPALRLVRLRAGCHCFLGFLCLILLVKCLLRLYVVRAPLLVVWTAGVRGS